VETPIFSKEITELLSDEEYRGLQLALLFRPEQGPLIPRGGGLRKIRWKRGGASGFEQAGKRETKVKKKDFDKLVASIKQAGQIKRGKSKPSRVFRFKPADIKAIREKIGVSQSEFALMIGVSVSTLQNWEQGRRQPDGPARALLKVAAENPEAVAEALTA